jgi:anti-anti-sigma factor
MQIIKGERSSTLRIQGTLDIGVADELRQALCDLIDGNPSLTLDLSEVDACDTAALQVLYAARKTTDGSGKHLQFVGLSGAAADTIAALRLSIGELEANGQADAV